MMNTKLKIGILIGIIVIVTIGGLTIWNLGFDKEPEVPETNDYILPSRTKLSFDEGIYNALVAQGKISGDKFKASNCGLIKYDVLYLIPKKSVYIASCGGLPAYWEYVMFYMKNGKPNVIKSLSSLFTRIQTKEQAYEYLGLNIAISLGPKIITNYNYTEYLAENTDCSIEGEPLAYNRVTKTEEGFEVEVIIENRLGKWEVVYAKYLVTKGGEIRKVDEKVLLDCGRGIMI